MFLAASLNAAVSNSNNSAGDNNGSMYPSGLGVGVGGFRNNSELVGMKAQKPRFDHLLSGMDSMRTGSVASSGLGNQQLNSFLNGPVDDRFPLSNHNNNNSNNVGSSSSLNASQYNLPFPQMFTYQHQNSTSSAGSSSSISSGGNNINNANSNKLANTNDYTTLSGNPNNNTMMRNTAFSTLNPMNSNIFRNSGL